MKTPRTINQIATRIWLLIAFGTMALLWAPACRAGLSGPYTNDFYTLHLWHLQDLNGSLGYDSQTANAQAVPMTVSNTPGINAFGRSTDQYFSYMGQPGPAPLYGYNYSIQTTQYSCFLSPWFQANPATATVYAQTAYTNICNFVNTNTGAFTFEALVQPSVDMYTYTVDKNNEILCGDNSGNTVTPPVSRGWQWRFDYATPSSGQAEVELNDINHTDQVGTNHDKFALLPTAGSDQFILGNWYHVAVAYTGSAPTNGDPANVLTFYWTLFSTNTTYAHVLTNFPNAFTYTNASSVGMLNWAANKLCTGLYPSNSLFGTPFFAIGGSARGNISNSVASGNGFDGQIAEVRISDYYRHTNEFMFNTNLAPSAPIVVGPFPTNNFIAYGQTLTESTVVSGFPTPILQWYQNGVALAGQTNTTLVIDNVTFAANGSYYLAATNFVGGTNSGTTVVTVGAGFQGLFNTGCDANNNPLDKTAPGSVDSHWLLTTDPDPVGVIPNAIVWGDQAPVQPNGILPENGNSVWIGPEENAGIIAGTYTYQTTFQIDETALTNAVLSGFMSVCGPNAGTTVQVTLNGAAAANITLPGNPEENTEAFAITNGLQAGSNTLTFTMVSTGSGGGANGINVALSGLGTALADAPVINNQPSAVMVNYGGDALFSVVALGAPALSYQWYSNNVPVVGATGGTLSFTATNFAPSEVVNGQFTANYQVVISNYQGAVTSSVAQLTINAGLSAVSAGQPIWGQTTNIVVIYSGAVDPVTASAAGNYSLDNGATVVSASVVASNEVALTTSFLTPGTSYTLAVQGVQNTIGVVMSPSPADLAVGIYPAATALWIKADTGVTTDASGVNQWNDLSGNGNDLYQPGGAPYEPQLATNSYIGKPVIRFTGTNETYMYAYDSTSLEITGDISIFTVAEFATLAGGTNGEIIGKTGIGTKDNVPAPYDYYAGTASTILYRGNGATDGAVNSYAAPGIGAPHLLDVVMQGTSVLHRLDANTNGGGVLATTISDAGQAVYIGTRADAKNRLTGDLAELIVIGSALSTNDRASMENYLVTRYNLPTGGNSYPVLSVSPVSSTNLSLGSVLTLPAVVTGTGPLWYQWFDVDNGTNITTGSTTGGVLNATLTVSNVPAGWNGDQLELTVSNQFGANSVYVSLSVVAGVPQIIAQPQALFFTEAGSIATNSVGAVGSFPLSYQWQFNGTNLNDNSQISGAQGAVLAINNVQTAETGNYQVIVANSYGSVTSSIADLVVIGDQPIGFNGSGTGWAANYTGSLGPPTISGNLLTLTDGNNGETRSFFFDYPQYIGGFEASFTYQAGGNMAADGISFCLQNDPRGTAAIGGGGGDLAVSSITPSYELEFNIYNSSGTGLGYSLDTDGTIGQNTEPGPINLGGGDPIGVSISYLQGTLSLTFTDSVAQTSYSTNFAVGSLANIVKGATAYVGFTGADGGLNSIQTISNFTFVSIPPATIQLNGTNTLISWPGTIQGYQLQESSDLVSGTWINVTNPTTVVNGTNQVTAPVTGDTMFYRLILQP